MFNWKEVAGFFDSRAPEWDTSADKNEAVISSILDNAGVTERKNILDVACGTGVLVPYYLKRNAAYVTGIDISPAMAETARSRFSRERVSIICGDAASEIYGRNFDCIIIYNSLPHFPDPENLIRHLSGFLKPDGILTVAHDAGSEKVNARHSGPASRVSRVLMPAKDLASIFDKYLQVTLAVDDERMYQVVGKIRPRAVKTDGE